MRGLFNRFRWLDRRARKEAELRAELEFHLEEEREDARARGLGELEARRAAFHDLGNLALVEEDTRAVWGWPAFERIRQDVRFAGRLLRRRPALSLTAILTLTLGIGGTTAVFSLMDALLMRSLPVEEPRELVRLVERRTDGTTAETFTLSKYDALQPARRTLSGLIASSRVAATPGEIEATGERRAAFVQFVSDNFFDVLGVQAGQGRVFHPPAPGAAREPIAVISDEYWRRQYNASGSAIGSRLRQGSREFTIAGVGPAGFRGVDIDVPVDIWVSIEHLAAPGAPARSQGRWVRITGRLRPEAAFVQAESEIATILGRAFFLEPGGIGYSGLRERLHDPLVLVAIASVLVLLIACANLANLMLSATLSRDREIAVRGAIGASRGRIIRQLVTESVLLSSLGAVLGIGFAYWTTGALLAFLPPEQAVALPNLRFALDARVLGFVGILSIVTCLLFGIAPALRVTGIVVSGGLKAGGGSTRRERSLLRRGLLVGQVAMCTGLLIVSSVFVRTLQNLRGQEAGYREDRLLVADVGIPRAYPESRRDQLIEDLVARAGVLPSVASVAFSHVGQLSGAAIEYRIAVPGRTPLADDPATTIEQRISPGFLGTMGTSLLSGRDFQPSDDARGMKVAIVNESFGRRFLAGQNPLGAGFTREGGSESSDRIEIVGVVRDSKWVNLRDASPPMYYRPYRQVGGTPTVRLVLRTSGEMEPVAKGLVGLARSMDAGLTLTNVVPFGEIVDRTLVTERLIARVSSAFGALALLIAAVGLYGVLAYSVVRRRREIGLRMALGALPLSIERMFLAESLALVAWGVGLGIPGGILVTRWASSLLFGLSPYDPASIASALLFLTATTIVAAYLPARKGARIDAMVVLREE